MHEFLFASARDTGSRALVAGCLEQIGEIPAAANLGFAYATDRLADDLPAILAQLQQEAPGVQWVGTVGMGICTSGRETYDCPALALMIGAFPDTDFRILSGVGEDPDRLPADLSDWSRDENYCFALLHADPSSREIPEFLSRLTHGPGYCFINGGLTSSSERNPQLANAVVSGGLSGVLFNDQVRILTDHTQGCTPIGPVHEITKAQHNIAIALDHRPALDIMKLDIGEAYAKDLSRIGGHIFAALPIRGSDTGDYLVRNLVGIDPRQGLVAVGEQLDDKQQLMFCRRDGDSAREDLERMLQRLHKRIDGAGVRGAVYISCLGRGRYQFGKDSEELKLIRRALGDFPLVGFFANGEIYNGRLYGYTGVLTLFL